MNRKALKKMIEEGRLRLSFEEKVTHYMIVIFLLIPTLFSLYSLFEYYILKKHTGVRTPWEMLDFSLPFAILAILFFIIQYRRLRFKMVKTNLTRDELQEIIINIGTKLKWKPLVNEEDIFIAETSAGWTGSWGERITIIFDENRILINSVCNPAGPSSIASMGRNRKNTQSFIKAIDNTVLRAH